MAELSSAPEPSVDPSYLLRAVRVFTAVVAEPQEKNLASDTAEVAAEDAGDTLGWEQAGCLVWDVAGLPDDAAFLLGHGLPAMLPPLLTAAAAREQWRVLEIGLGVAANLACHKEAREQLLQLEGLPELLLDQLLWVDDSASLAELCRCVAGLLPGAARGEASERWWALLLREETLGRLVWILENTLASPLLERALNLLSCLVTAAVAAMASGDGGKAVLVPQLAVLGLLPLLASVLHGWAVKLQAEGQHFGAEEGRGGEGGSGGGSPAAAGSGGAAGPMMGHEKLPAGKRGGSVSTGPAAESTSPAAAAAAAAINDSGLEGDAAAGGAVAAEVTEQAVLEALALLEALAADEAGEASLNASAPIKDALLRTVAEADQRSTQALATSLLAGLEGVGPQLLAQPAALAALLRRLATAAAERPGKRAKTNGEAGSGGGSVVVAAAAAGPGSEEEQAEEVEATWALCSALARAVSAEAETGAGGEEAAGEQGQLGAAAPALGVMAEQMDALCHDWSSSPRAAAIQMHQAYVLRRLGPLLEPRVEGPGKQALRGALARCEAATVPA